MTIKEVEKRTGLTAKSIRLYEQKGLLEVDRNLGNDYREYTEENLETLKWIKLYRYLEFSLEEIKELLAEDTAFCRAKLEEKHQQLEGQKEDLTLKASILKTLLSEKENVNIEEYAMLTELSESEEYDGFKSVLLEAKLPSRGWAWWLTIHCIVPIGVFILEYEKGRMEQLPWFGFLSLVMVGIASAAWARYFSLKRLYKDRLKAQRRENRVIWRALPFALISVFFSILACQSLSDGFAPENWLFYCEKGTFIEICTCGLVLSCFGLPIAVSYCIRDRKLWRTLGILLCCGAVWGLSAYCTATNNVYVTVDSVVVSSPFKADEVYSYEDITLVETGFDCNRSKTDAEFFYRITVRTPEGEETYTFGVVSGNDEIDRYAEDTHLELLDFDKVLMDLGIPKESSEAYAEYLSMEDVYRERFLQIVRNKPKSQNKNEPTVR